MRNMVLVLAVLLGFAGFAKSMGYGLTDVRAALSQRFSMENLRLVLGNEIGAVTRKADVTNYIAKIWSNKLYMQAEKLTFWQMFEGPEGSNMPVIRRDELEGKPADTIKTDIVLNLTGAGLTGDTTLLEGNEEKIVLRQMEFSVNSLKNAVRWSDLADLLITHDMRTLAYEELSRWLAGQLDNRIFNELTGQSGFSTLPTKNKWAAGTATTRATVADTDAGGRLTLDEISRIKAYAKTEIKIQPLRLENGEEIYGFVLHPYTALSLKINDTKWAQAQREAEVRGKSNPLFTGALGMWDGVVLYEAERVPRSLNGNTPDIQVADNIFFGAQAISRGYTRRPVWREQEFSYGEEIGVATIVVFGQKANIFDLNATETTGDATDDTAIGHMVVYAAAVAPTQP